MSNFKIANSVSDLEKYFEVMKILRPHVSLESFLTIYKSAHEQDGYEVVGYINEDEVVAVMGYRILYDLVRGKHIYVDDLITMDQFRSKGIGQKFLTYAEEIAKKNHCSVVRLCTGIENLGGIQFYERQGYQKKAFAYSKKV